MKNLVVYYSKSGSNKYIAEKIAARLECPIEALEPRIFNMFLFLIKVDFGNKPIKSKLNEYDRIILVGPVMMGRLIPPLKSFIKKYSQEIKKIVFVSCCGSGDEARDKKFGHGLVFNNFRELIGEKCEFCEALPIDLVLEGESKKNSELIMKTRINDSNFNGDMQNRFEKIIENLKSVRS